MITSILIAIAIVSATVSAVLMRQVIISNVCNIVIVTPPPPQELKLKVYEDEACTVALTQIDWGTLNPPVVRARASTRNWSMPIRRG